MNDTVLETQPLDTPWVTTDPFLFCMHHDDAYPRGNAQMGPDASLEGRRIGEDFEGKDGWRMYHGRSVPGFPQHPHRGFETVTILRRGYVDHADSLGAAARLGPGDVQWITAGGGIVHSEMFPLLETAKPNPLELFQIWLNLPPADKLAEPHFTMSWAHQVPRVKCVDAAGREVEVMVVAGRFGDRAPPPPPPRSWASREDADVAIWSIRMTPRATWTLPSAAHPMIRRTLYLFRGPGLRVDGAPIAPMHAVTVKSDRRAVLEAGDGECEILLLQGRPIGEPVVQHGPFVMNTRAEIRRAIEDYQRTRFGGWPWPTDDPVHPRDAGRFAKHADGRVERADAEV